MSNDRQVGLFGQVSNPVEVALQLGEAFAASGMFGCSKPQQGAILALQCMTSGATPFEVTQTYHLLDGKLSMKADAMLGKFLRAGGKVEWGERTSERVSARFSYKGNVRDETITLQELVATGVAVDARGELKAMYKRFPRQMLTARLVSEYVRLLAPDIISGVYTPEEVSDFEDAPYVPPSRHDPPKVVDAEEVEEQRPEQDPEQEFRELLGEHYPSALVFFGSKLSNLSTKTQSEIRSRTAALIAKLK